ncbi:outer membrane protein [Paracoccus marinaquae]|uniref:Porin family protein n=1 Tax=Paracoccus marinaquae TaxID=2841926 RepID=A0ABS6AK06_9RHOB|nr:outer membrane protein [Paracoccus marinaquae]MBU3030913.1 porin family protein [Paracoccus marinaquae]
MAISKTLVLAASAATLGMTGIAMAGGYSAPVEPAPVMAPVALPESPSDWAGGYVGGSIGYGWTSDEDLRVDGAAGSTTPGSLEMDGAVYGLHTGYRWQNQNWVYGVEGSVLGGNLDDSLDSNGYTAEQEMKYAVSLKGQLGYLVNPATLVYGSVGVAHGKFDVAYNGAAGMVDSDFSRTGYSLGLGVERKLNDNWSLRGDYEYMNFGDETVRGTAGSSATFEPELHKVSMGVNYRF